MEDYLTVIKALMQQYNDHKEEKVREAIFSSIYSPNAATLAENYEKNRRCFEQEGLILPAYEEVPFLFLPITESYCLAFDKERKIFLDNEINSLAQIFYQKAVLGEFSDAVGQMKKWHLRYQRQQDGKKLFKRLNECLEGKALGADYYPLARQLAACLPENEIGEYFLCRYYLERGDYKAALTHARKVYAKRKLAESSLYLMARSYEGLGQYEKAAHYYTLYIAYYLRMGLDINLSISRRVQEVINRVWGCRENSILNMVYAPIYQRLSIGKGGLEFSNEAYLGKFLFNDKDNFWCGLYNENKKNGVLSKVYRAVFELNDINIIRDADFTYDFMKVELKKEAKVIPPAGKAILLPIAGAAEDKMSDVLFKTASFEQKTFLAENEFSFFRLTEPTKIKGDRELAFGRPLLLEHSPKRRKLVLNILSDAMSWGQIKADGYRDIPHIRKFFEKGLIFDNQYTVSEYTYPSLATIETGLYPQHTQIIHGDFYSSLPPKRHPLSEQMQELGYYCVNAMGDPESVYDGVGRGYDRIIANHIILDATKGIERLLSHLKAFRETDNFVFCHFTDTHPFSKADYAVGVQEQVELGLKEHLNGIEDVKSVFLGKNPLNMNDYKLKLSHFDAQMQKLFDYLEENYAEDEYIVNLYSDHGTSVCVDSPYLLNEHQINSALLMRGFGIPPKGIVSELTSTADIYPALAHLLEFKLPYDNIDGCLPRVFGGRGRDYTVSNSIYPGQTYKICIHTLDYVFYLESKELTAPEGIVDLNEFTYHIYERNNLQQEIYNDVLRDYFLDIVYEYTKEFRKPF